MTTDPQKSADLGRRVAVETLRDRGATVSEVRSGRIVFLEVRTPLSDDGGHVRVRARTGGTWQGSTGNGAPAPAPAHPLVVWIFMDLSRADRPTLYVVPDDWMRRDINREHQEYLARHGGEWAISKDSTHHAIQLTRIAQWKDCWEPVGLDGGAT